MLNRIDSKQRSGSLPLLRRMARAVRARRWASPEPFPVQEP